MERISEIKELREKVEFWKAKGLTIGFVPTMGYLHEGHESLIKKAAEESDKVVVSIFVNPTQFGENEDLDAYPRDLERDKQICERANCDLIFNPMVKEIYGDDFASFVEVDKLTKGLCGKSRPIHFRGVCTIVCKLFNIVNPDRAYFGEKDAQQLAVIKKMVKDLNINVEVIGCPIIRKNDGLAKSSRNAYLSESERKAAVILSKSLDEAKKIILEGEREGSKIFDVIKRTLESEPLATIDYIEIVDSKSLEKVERMRESVLIAIAVFIGEKTRLIDNFTYEF